MKGAGSYRHIITIEKPTDGTPDGMGNTFQSWVALYTDIHAFVNPVSAKEMFVAEKNQIAISHRVSMRYAPDVDSTCRILFESRYLSIEGVINVENRNRELVIGCKEAVQ